MTIKSLFRTSATTDKKFPRPYIIAEAGVNHEGKIELAKRLIDEACQGGADAIKFQTYKAETIASRSSPAYWDLRKEPTLNQYELFKKYDVFWKKEFEQLKIHCDRAGIDFLSTPFDLESAEFLNDLIEAFKISSSDITNRPFIEFICQFKKPIILSTGASYLYEIEEAVSWVEPYDVPLALLHCVLNYPTDSKDANLGMILHLKEKYPDKVIGYSDHTLPGKMNVLEIAAILGARILEKHFTFDKTLPGNDHYHAMDKTDLELLMNKLENIRPIIGSCRKHPLLSEKPARENARRSIVAKREITIGKRIETDDLTWKRPAFGISPKHMEEVVGRVTTREIKKDEIITWSMMA